jgi:hypothetical protein
VAVSSAGIFFVQETGEFRDHVDRLNELNSPTPTGLNCDAIAGAMGHPDAAGNIQALAVSGDWLFFYFAGSEKRDLVACVGRYSIADHKLQILADTDRLGQLTGAAGTLSLYRPEMMTSGNSVWLWLHAIDGSCFLQIDPANADPTTAIRRDFDRLTCDFQQPDFTHDGYFSVGAGPQGSLLIEDRWMCVLWEISPNGHTVEAASLTLLPREMSPPAMDGQRQINFFVADSPALAPRETSPQPPKMPAVDFPALLYYHDQEFDDFGKVALLSDKEFPAEELRFSSLVPNGDQTGWIACDTTVGEIFQIHLIAR